MSLRMATSELKHKQLQQREYAASVAAHSLRGFMAARDQYFEAERRRRLPQESSPSPPLMRSTIRSPLETRSHASSSTAANANVNANVKASSRNASSERSHPRRKGRNGTPVPEEMLGVAPMTTMTPFAMSSTSDRENKTPVDSHAAYRKANTTAPSKLLGMSMSSL